MRRMKRLGGHAAAVLMTGVSIFVLSVSAQTSVTLQSFKSGLNSPIFVTNAGDGTNRIFIVERGGVIKVVQPVTGAISDFLNISAKISLGGERGLLGLAFHPQYNANRRFFVYYTRAGDGAIQIAEYQASISNSNVADTTEKIIITIPHPVNNNHNGGTIAFGPDGYLYAGTGDGGSANDPPNNAQNIDVLLGKFIRLDVDAGSPYAIPSTNPFVNAPGADEIYALGLRNPFRWSFDRGGSRQLWAADVGQGAIEEVDIINAGGNYGWRVFEGTQCTNLDPVLCDPANFTAPIFQYTHSAGRCSIIGGYVYRGTRNTLPSGAYVHGDYCTGEIWALIGGQQTLLLNTADFNLISFGEDESGELYVVGQGGTVDKIVALVTAASATVGGRVTEANGRGIFRARVTLIDSQGVERVAYTNPQGYYSFSDVPGGQTYIFSVRHLRYQFAPPSLVEFVDEDNPNINFTSVGENLLRPENRVLDQ